MSDGDFNLMCMSAVGHDIDVSEVDQDTLAWFLDSDLTQVLQQVPRWSGRSCLESSQS